MTERLFIRIYSLMQTNPQKLWTYEELSLTLGVVKKTVCSRCLDLYNANKIDKVMVSTGRPRGRMALLFIKPKEQHEYPSWLVPSPAPDIDKNAPLSIVHRLDVTARKNKKTLAD